MIQTITIITTTRGIAAKHSARAPVSDVIMAAVQSVTAV
jgi:hypothetical protein